MGRVSLRLIDAHLPLGCVHVLRPECCRVTQTPSTGLPLSVVCRRYKTYLLDQSLRCPPWKRTRAVMIRLLDWYTLTWKAKKKSLPRLEDPHNALPVNVPSAIVIAVGFPTSITPTDALSINIGSSVNATAIGMAWVLVDALMLPGDTPFPMRQLKLRKARELSPLPFPTHLLIANSCFYLEYAAWAPCELSSSIGPGRTCPTMARFVVLVLYDARL